MGNVTNHLAEFATKIEYDSYKPNSVDLSRLLQIILFPAPRPDLIQKYAIWRNNVIRSFNQFKAIACNNPEIIEEKLINLLLKADLDQKQISREVVIRAAVHCIIRAGYHPSTETQNVLSQLQERDMQEDKASIDRPFLLVHHGKFDEARPFGEISAKIVRDVARTSGFSSHKPS